jgi:hypothetical protein
LTLDIAVPVLGTERSNGVAIGDAMTNDEQRSPDAAANAPQLLLRSKRSVWSCLAPIAVSIIGFVLFSYFSTLPRSTENWTEFVPDSGEFSVLMPRTPRESHEKRGLLTLTLSTRIFTASAGGGTEQCSVAIYDFSELERDVLGSEEELLETICDGMANEGRKLSDVRAVSLAGYPGRELVCERPRVGATAFSRTRMCLAGRRLYVLTFSSWREPRLWTKEAESFLTSFKLLENSAPARADGGAGP